MSPFSLLVMSMSMSADAFAVSISKGTEMKSPNVIKALQIGLLFGVIEALTPIIGWFIGLVASGLIESIDHWIAFIILSLVGGKMIYEGFKSNFSNHKTESLNKEKADFKFSQLSLLVLTAIGTSIDAMAVGVSLAFMEVNIWFAAIAIGTATTAMVFVGIMAGHYLGAKVGKSAEALGGLALILIGTHILLSHTGYL